MSKLPKFRQFRSMATRSVGVPDGDLTAAAIRALCRFLERLASRHKESSAVRGAAQRTYRIAWLDGDSDVDAMFVSGQRFGNRYALYLSRREYQETVIRATTRR